MAKPVIKTNQITSCNILRVSAGTSCPQGGDAGHGGITTIKFEDEGGTGWKCIVDGIETDSPESIEIQLFGDSEAATMIEALEFAIETLKLQMSAD